MWGLDAVDVVSWPAAIAGALTACGVIWRAAIRPVIRWGRRIETTVVFVEHELKANSGKSMRDAIDKVHVQLDKGDARFDDLDDRLGRIEQRLAEQGPQQITIVGSQPTPPDQEDPS